MRRKLGDNLKRIRERMQAACARSGRRIDDVRLIAVTKTVEVDVIRSALDLGLTDLGESRVQELVKRASMVQEHLSRRRGLHADVTASEPCWHMVGHLQRNKVRLVLPWAEYIHSLDSLRLAEEISGEATRQGRTVPLFIEVNVSGEKSKYGVAVGAAGHLAAHIAAMPGIRIVGLMTMAPYSDNPEEARPHFARLREVYEDMRSEKVAGPHFRELSMGMSGDFEVAIEEGATMIRVGTALFDGLS